MTTTKQRIALALHNGIHVCHSCLNAIDPECCHCGEKITPGQHNWQTYHEGHTPIPAGCMCGYLDDKYREHKWLGVPAYDTSLDALHEVEMGLTDEQFEQYAKYLVLGAEKLSKDATKKGRAILCADAPTRLSALVRTLGLWVEPNISAQ